MIEFHEILFVDCKENKKWNIIYKNFCPKHILLFEKWNNLKFGKNRVLKMTHDGEKSMKAVGPHGEGAYVVNTCFVGQITIFLRTIFFADALRSRVYRRTVTKNSPARRP